MTAKKQKKPEKITLINRETNKPFTEAELLHKATIVPLFWGKLFCPHYFGDKFAQFHYDVMKLAVKSQFLAIAAPRGSAKSTLLTFLYPLHLIVHKRNKYIIILMNTHKKSIGALRGIKDEFKDNRNIKNAYKVKIVKDAEDDTIFRHPDGFQTRVLCTGSDQIGSIRGERAGASRPDLVIIDDLEDDELVRSAERRNKLKNDFDSVIEPMLDSHVGRIIAIGTILHDDCLMNKLISKDHYPRFEKSLYKALPDEETSLWQEKWSVERLHEMRKENPSVFAKEYQNDPVSDSMQRFFAEDFRTWRVENNNYILLNADGSIKAKGELSSCRAAIACDLAWEEKKESDYAVIMPAFLTPQSELLVDNYICKKGLRPHEIEETLFSMEARLRTITGSSVPVGFEKANLEKVVRHLLKEAMKTRNHYLILKDLEWTKDKISRIETRLEPRYKQHVIYHKTGMGDLEYQLLKFPSGAHEDLPDALQGLVQLLQYPKSKKKPDIVDDEFEWWRKRAMKHKKPDKTPYVFGKSKRYGIKATEAYR